MRGGIATGQNCSDSVLGPQSDGGKELYGMAGNERQVELLGDRRQQQGGFHRGKGSADASPWTAAKGKIGTARQLLFKLCRPTVGIEAQGIVPIARIAVDEPLADEDVGAFRQPVSSDFNRA